MVELCSEVAVAGSVVVLINVLILALLYSSVIQTLFKLKKYSQLYHEKQQQQQHSDKTHKH